MRSAYDSLTIEWNAKNRCLWLMRSNNLKKREWLSKMLMTSVTIDARVCYDHHSMS